MNRLGIYKAFKLIAISLLFLLSKQSFTQSKERDRGLLWKITDNGLKKPSYLYGTMHVSAKVAFHLSDSFFVAIKSSDVIALETNPAEWMDDMLSLGFINQTFGMYNQYSNHGGEDFYNRAFKVDPPKNKDISKKLSQDNQMMNGLLYRFSGYRDDFEENTYLDMFIFQAGSKLKKDVAALEDFEESMKMVRKSMMHDKDEKQELRDMSEFYEEGQSLGELLENAYRRGDLAQIDSLSTIMNPFSNYRKYMLNERNKVMVLRMDSIMKNQTVFAGIGVAHLPGDTGVISLLRMKGYTVEPVTASIGSKSIKAKEKIEKQKYSLQYTKQSLGNGFITINSPGKMYDIPCASRWEKNYFYPEMINGAYINIDRTSSMAAFTGQSEEYILDRIDSLLFENIPGKIIKKKRIEKNGFKGIDIQNKTKKGDKQRYNIFVTPLEIIVIKMGATGGFANKSETDQFFGSLKFIQPKKEWTSYKPSFGEFMLDVPPGYTNWFGDTLSVGVGTVNPSLHAYDPTTGVYYFYSQIALHDYEYLEEDSFELSYLAECFYEEIDFSPIDTIFENFNGYPSITMMLKSDNDASRKIKLRIIINGAKYHYLVAVGKEGKINDRFFNSFKFDTYRYKKELTQHTDTNQFFTVTTHVIPQNNSFTKELTSFYEELNDEEEGYHRAKTTNANYTSPAQEDIKITFRKLHNYDGYESYQEIWDEWIKSMKRGTKIISDSSFVNNSALFYPMQITLKDTATLREIKMKAVFNHGALWLLHTISHEGKPLSPFVDEFYKTFKPATDTLIGRSILEDKVAMYFTNILSEDSATHAVAEESLEYIRFKDEHAPQLIDMIKIYRAEKNELGYRVQLIEALGTIEHPDIIPFFEEYYKQVSDTSTLQLAILEELANKNTALASKSFLKLITQETPLSSKKNDTKYLFYGYKDSLVTAKLLYPDLLKLTKYPEYKDKIYDLLTTLIDSNVVKSGIYASYKSNILEEAKDELKRQFSKEEGMEDKSDSRYYNNYDHYDKTSSTLENYVKLLLPYRNEKIVKQFFDKLDLTKDDDLKLSISYIYLNNGIPVNDTVWTYYSKHPKYLVSMYKKLEKYERLDVLKNDSISQQDIAYSMLYPFEIKKYQKDTIAFLDRRIIKNIPKNNREEGYVYFFKSKYEEDENWYLGYVGIQPLEEGEFRLERDFYKKRDIIYKGEDLTKKIDGIMKEISLDHRKRVRFNSNSYRGLINDYDY